MKHIFLFILFFIIGIGIVFSYSYTHNKKNGVTVVHSPVSSEEDTFNIDNPPPNSQKGIIQTLSGDVAFESRSATEPASITNPTPVQQGERILTKDDGTALIAFNEIGQISMKKKSELSIIQTLPSHFVFQQSSGIIDYTNTQQSSLSVRTLHTLIVLKEAEATISLDTDTNKIIYSIQKGSATIAYNNSDNITTFINLTEGEEYIFSDDDREGRIVKI